MERWRMMNPARVYERIQAQEQARAARTKEAIQEQAKQKLKDLFKEPPDVTDNR